MKKIYIAGPMRNHPYYNYASFKTVEQELVKLGYDAVNPHTLDFNETGFNVLDLPPDTDWTKIPSFIDLKNLVMRDISSLTSCDAIFILPGWENSIGASAELAVAHWLNLRVLKELPKPAKDYILE